LSNELLTNDEENREEFPCIEETKGRGELKEWTKSPDFKKTRLLSTAGG